MDCQVSGQRPFPLWSLYVMNVSHLMLGKEAGRGAEQFGNTDFSLQIHLPNYKRPEKFAKYGYRRRGSAIVAFCPGRRCIRWLHCSVGRNNFFPIRKMFQLSLSPVS